MHPLPQDVNAYMAEELKWWTRTNWANVLSRLLLTYGIWIVGVLLLAYTALISGLLEWIPMRPVLGGYISQAWLAAAALGYGLLMIADSWKLRPPVWNRYSPKQFLAKHPSIVSTVADRARLVRAEKPGAEFEFAVLEYTDRKKNEREILGIIFFQAMDSWESRNQPPECPLWIWDQQDILKLPQLVPSFHGPGTAL